MGAVWEEKAELRTFKSCHFWKWEKRSGGYPGTAFSSSDREICFCSGNGKNPEGSVCGRRKNTCLIWRVYGGSGGKFGKNIQSEKIYSGKSLHGRWETMNCL